jgi:ferritin
MSQLSNNLLILLNEQYAHEKQNQLIYEQSASVADFFGLDGTAKFFKDQAVGEQSHATMVYDFINKRNEKALIANVECPDVPQEFYQLFTFAMDVELRTTEKLKAIALAAIQEADLQTFYWIADLIKEQTEEENITRTILDRFATCGMSQEQIHHYDIWIGSL